MGAALRLGLLVAVALTAWSWSAATPAGAHDELATSVPADDEHLDTAPPRVVLRFGGSPMEMGSTILVTDADGNDWVDAPPVVAGSDVSAELRAGMPDGYYQARWQVVSEDGAVISGVVDFSVGDTTGAAEIALPRSDARDDTNAATNDTSAVVDSPDDEPDPDRNWGRLIAASVVGALAGVGLLSATTGIARQRAGHTTDVPSGSNPPTPETTHTQEDPT